MLTQDQINFLDYVCKNAEWKEENGVINTDGSVIIQYFITEIPVQFGQVFGDFICAGNKLTNLRGCPSIVTGYFDCGNNRLTTLEGGPKDVGGYYSCSANQLSNLIGAPVICNDNFNCTQNQLHSLEGCPKIIRNNFICTNNLNLRYLWGIGRVNGDVYYDNRNVLNNWIVRCAKDNIIFPYDTLEHNIHWIKYTKNYSCIPYAPENVRQQFSDINLKLDTSEFINYTGTINSTPTGAEVIGNVTIKGNCNEIPEKFTKIYGDFICSNNRITNLHNSPSLVSKTFNCSFNQLTDLYEGPLKVKNYYCNNNILTNLNGAPKTEVELFNCSSNKLINLSGAPEKVLNFICQHNYLTSLIGAPFECDYLDCRNNKSLQYLFGIGRVKEILYDNDNEINNVIINLAKNKYDRHIFALDVINVIIENNDGNFIKNNFKILFDNVKNEECPTFILKLAKSLYDSKLDTNIITNILYGNIRNDDFNFENSKLIDIFSEINVYYDDNINYNKIFDILIRIFEEFQTDNVLKFKFNINKLPKLTFNMIKYSKEINQYIQTFEKFKYLK